MTMQVVDVLVQHLLIVNLLNQNSFKKEVINFIKDIKINLKKDWVFKQEKFQKMHLS